MAWTDRLEAAAKLAVELHRKQTRKGSRVPYVNHLFAVMDLVAEAGGDEDQQVAALLHDAAEDQGGQATLDRIREAFGARVADMVAGCSDTFEEPKPPWRPRKQAFLDGLRDAPREVLLIVAADKLHNLRSTLMDARKLGDAVFERFSGGKDGTLWYYAELAEIVRGRVPEPLGDELAETSARLRRLVDAD